MTNPLCQRANIPPEPGKTGELLAAVAGCLHAKFMGCSLRRLSRLSISRSSFSSRRNEFLLGCCRLTIIPSSAQNRPSLKSVMTNCVNVAGFARERTRWPISMVRWYRRSLGIIRFRHDDFRRTRPGDAISYCGGFPSCRTSVSTNFSDCSGSSRRNAQTRFDRDANRKYRQSAGIMPASSPN